MSKQEYEEYVARVDKFLADNDVRPGCYGPNPDYGEAEYRFFTWQACSCCKRPSAAGLRYEYTFATNGGAFYDAAICADCIYYLACGKLDDVTMLGMEDVPA